MQFNPMSLDITPSGILRTSTLPTCDGWREKRESEKGPKPWKTGSVAKCQVRKNNPVSLSENGVVQKQRETLCRGFMVLECGRGFKPSHRTGEYCCGCLSPVCGNILFAL